MDDDYDPDPNDMPQPDDAPPAAASAAPMRTATNPKTGQKIMLQNGRWVAAPATGPTGPPAPANAAQAKLRVLTADQPVAGQEMNQLMTQVDPKTGKPTRPSAMANFVDDGLGGVLPHLGIPSNMFRDDAQQTLSTAGNQWITSAAHALSGARIGQEQLHQLLVSYIPAATDQPGNLAFKAAQRQRLQDGIASASGLAGGQLSPEQADALVQILHQAPPAEQGRAALTPYVGAGAAGTATPKATSAGPVQIKGDADYMKLPSGTHFLDPDGHLRTKP